MPETNPVPERAKQLTSPMENQSELLDPKEKIDILVSRIKFTASQRHALDRSSDEGEYCPIDAGSYDDAFNDGARVGEIDFARELCELLGVNYGRPED
jgi:hypothetical protein